MSASRATALASPSPEAGEPAAPDVAAFADRAAAVDHAAAGDPAPAIDDTAADDPDACAHCGLPLASRVVTAAIDGATLAFCCYGCVLARQITRARGDGAAAGTIVVRLGLAVFFAMNVMMVSMPAYVPYVYGPATDGPLFQVLRVLALAFAAPVLVLLGGPILASAWRSARAGAANADGLIIVGAVAAYALSVVHLWQGRSEVYFDTAAMLLVLVTLGRWLEASAKASAGAAVASTLAAGPPTATRLTRAAGGGRVIETVPSEALAPGDVVRVVSGEAFPTDGAIVAGFGGVDESSLTGESRPIVKEPGASVASGTCSVDGVFEVRVTARAADSAAARIARLLAEARRRRAPMERLADATASALVPLIIVVAVGAGGFWAWQDGAGRGILVALAVLVVACPCALGIATPVAVWTGLAAAARHGVVVRNAPVLERLADVGRVLFDKTGTLTSRTPRLVAIERANGSRSADDLIARAAALEQGLPHPLARAVTAAYAAAFGDRPLPAAHVMAVVPGRGVRGTVDGTPTVIGNVELAAAEAGVSAAGLATAGVHDDIALTSVLVEDGRVVAVLRFAEDPKPEAASAIAALRGLGVRVGLLSGDAAACAVVPRLVDAADAALGLTPEGKVDCVRAARDAGGKTDAVAMVGDGINDAPALAAADVGIAVVGGADLARANADVLVLADDLGRIPWLVAHARRVTRVGRQNLAWSFAYNAVAVALAAMGALTPLVAAVAMIGSSALVVANARRLATGRGARA